MPERSDASQEGITLPPANFTRMLAREEAWRAINEHAEHCSFSTDDHSNRLRQVEISMGRLIGFMLGSGALGGATGGLAAAAIKLLAP